jgi:hypothetical protein
MINFTERQGRRKVIDDNGVVRDPMWFEDDDTAAVVEHSYWSGWMDGAITSFAVTAIVGAVAFGVWYGRQP